MNENNELNYELSSEELEIDDVDANLNKKKKINSKKKGNRIELALTKILSKHFNLSFSRSVGSGNRWGQVTNMPSHAKATLTGDICPPEDFQWVIECKGGYEDLIDFNSILDGGCACLDNFIKQSTHDNKESGRKPLIIWKRARKPWLVMLHQKELDAFPLVDYMFEYRIRYREWTMLPLERLLAVTPIEFWFKS